MFGNGVEQDAKDSTQQIFAIYAGGLGLPDRDYYLKDDDKSKETRAKYVEHVAKMLELSGDTPESAKTGAAAVMRIETALAKASLTRVERRDPYKIYHHTVPSKLKSLVPAFDWEGYFSAVGGRPGAWLNVSEPAFFKELGARLKAEPLADLKTYLRWAVVSANSDYLSKAFVDEHFAFYRATLRGVKEAQPRWKKCVGWVDRDLGEALGKEFADRAFPPENKAKTVAMTNLIVTAMKQRIEGLDWMSEATKKQAIDKLGKVRNKVGYPDAWRDYSKLEVKRGDFFGNVGQAIVFETKRQLAKIGKPVDRGEWGMTPPTVNAYYNASMNDINFPAGVLMPPLYDPKIDDAPNYGNTGSTIGHELTHGFDDEGRQFDGDGNLRDWWTKKDGVEFEKRANCVRDQYSQYVVVDDIINGFALSYRGVETKAYVYTEREAGYARLMPPKKSSDTGKQVLCPMPGLVVSIAVKEGQEVKAGELVAVVEAMKMENVLRAEIDGTVKKINAKPGDSLAVDAVILEFT